MNCVSSGWVRQHFFRIKTRIHWIRNQNSRSEIYILHEMDNVCHSDTTSVPTALLETSNDIIKSICPILFRVEIVHRCGKIILHLQSSGLESGCPQGDIPSYPWACYRRSLHRKDLVSSNDLCKTNRSSICHWDKRGCGERKLKATTNTTPVPAMKKSNTQMIGTKPISEIEFV